MGFHALNDIKFPSTPTRSPDAKLLVNQLLKVTVAGKPSGKI